MFQENQHVRIKVGDNPFIGPIKRVCQTFFRNPNLFAPYNRVWKPISMHTIEEKRPMLHISTTGKRELYVTDDQIILTPGGKCRFVKDLTPGDVISIEESICGSDTDTIATVVSVSQAGDWLFSIKVSDITEPYFALENGIICRGEL